MEKWRRVWRQGLAPQLSLKGLEALYVALVKDNDFDLAQGKIVEDGYKYEEGDEKEIYQAGAIGFCAWKGDGICTAEGVMEFYIRVGNIADRLLRGLQCEFSDFTKWYDTADRDEMRLGMIYEVALAIEAKKGATP